MLQFFNKYVFQIIVISLLMTEALFADEFSQLKKYSQENYDGISLFEDLEFRAETDTHLNKYEYNLRIKPGSFTDYGKDLYRIERKKRINNVIYLSISEVVNSWNKTKKKQILKRELKLLKSLLRSYDSYVRIHPLERDLNAEVEVQQWLHSPLLEIEDMDSRKYKIISEIIDRKKGGGDLVSDAAKVTGLYNKKISLIGKVGKPSLVRFLGLKVGAKKDHRYWDKSIGLQVAFELPLDITQTEQNKKRNIQNKIFREELEKTKSLQRMQQIQLEVKSLGRLISQVERRRRKVNVSQVLRKSPGSPREKLQFLLKYLKGKYSSVNLKYNYLMMTLEYTFLSGKLESQSSLFSELGAE